MCFSLGGGGGSFFDPMKTDISLDINLSLPLIKMQTDFTSQEYKSLAMRKTISTQLKLNEGCEL